MPNNLCYKKLNMSLKNLSVKIKIPKLLKDKLKNKKIIQIYKKFEKSIQLKENFSVAVSGGPDSLALAFLAKIYSLDRNIISNFYIVDHRLRPESTKEAKNVKNVLKNKSFKILNDKSTHLVLVPRHPERANLIGSFLKKEDITFSFLFNGEKLILNLENEITIVNEIGHLNYLYSIISYTCLIIKARRRRRLVLVYFPKKCSK